MLCCLLAAVIRLIYLWEQSKISVLFFQPTLNVGKLLTQPYAAWSYERLPMYYINGKQLRRPVRLRYTDTSPQIHSKAFTYFKRKQIT
jgi:hypothetical protein